MKTKQFPSRETLSNQTVTQRGQWNLWKPQPLPLLPHHFHHGATDTDFLKSCISISHIWQALHRRLSCKDPKLLGMIHHKWIQVHGNQLLAVLCFQGNHGAIFLPTSPITHLLLKCLPRSWHFPSRWSAQFFWISSRERSFNMYTLK